MNLPGRGLRSNNICVFREVDFFTSGLHPDAFKGGARTGRQLHPMAPGGSDWQRVSLFVRRPIFDPWLLCYRVKPWATHRGIEKGPWRRVWEKEKTAVASEGQGRKTTTKPEDIDPHTYCATSQTTKQNFLFKGLGVYSKTGCVEQRCCKVN